MPAQFSPGRRLGSSDKGQRRSPTCRDHTRPLSELYFTLPRKASRAGLEAGAAGAFG